MARFGLEGVQLLIFDTHGESIGRGGHPESLRDRLNYVSSPAARGLFIRNGIPFKEEVSFQGGDGYVYFMNPTSAFATVCRILENVLETPQASEGDPFYEDTDYVTEFFSTIKGFNTQVMDDANYAALLGAFGTNMLYPSGSRSIVRQSEVNASRDHPSHPSEMRAIPHNSILQQLGMLANTLGGVGQAIQKDEVRFRALYDESDRFRRLMGMVKYAFSFSDARVQLQRRRRAEGLCRHLRSGPLAVARGPHRAARPQRGHAASVRASRARRASRDAGEDFPHLPDGLSGHPRLAPDPGRNRGHPREPRPGAG
jgi:phosphoenolpyruvate carboxylase